MLVYKCLRFGKELFIEDERDTTRMCHVCKRKQDMPLWIRTYRCENCGLVMDRDENSAVNIYQRFLARPGPHALERVRCAVREREHRRGREDSTFQLHAAINTFSDVLKGIDMA